MVYLVQQICLEYLIVCGPRKSFNGFSSSARAQDPARTQEATIGAGHFSFPFSLASIGPRNALVNLDPVEIFCNMISSWSRATRFPLHKNHVTRGKTATTVDDNDQNSNHKIRIIGIINDY